MAIDESRNLFVDLIARCCKPKQKFDTMKAFIIQPANVPKNGALQGFRFTSVRAAVDAADRASERQGDDLQR